jgi:hypothetical protein
MKRTHETSCETDARTPQLDTLDILYEYVRQSGLYNMCFPVEEARNAYAAILAVAVYIGQPLDWEYLVDTPTWPSRVQGKYSCSPDFPRLVRDAADALPGGATFCATSSFKIVTPRMQMSQRDIVREAVTECLRWAKDPDAVARRHYRDVIEGAQRLEDERELAPEVSKKKTCLGPYYMQRVLLE